MGNTVDQSPGYIVYSKMLSRFLILLASSTLFPVFQGYLPFFLLATVVQLTGHKDTSSKSPEAQLTTRPQPQPGLISEGPVAQVESTVDKIVEIISGYLSKDSADDQFESVGRTRLRATVSRYVESGEQMELVFPAFPYKSASLNKVLGVLPDLAEEMLLKRLNSLARDIGEHHPAGAVVRLVSDGIVYQHLLYRPAHVPFRYSLELRRMIAELNLTHLSMISPFQLIDRSSSLSEATMTEEEYVMRLPELRARFFEHKLPGFDLEEVLQNDIGSLRTYLGYTKFLEYELEGQPCMEFEGGKKLSKTSQVKVRKRISKAMMEAGAQFSDIVSKAFSGAIRLSCHAHGNAGPKYAFDMFPGASRLGAATPWHNVVMQKLDGSLVVDHLRSFDPATYEIAERYGRPYFIREITTKTN